MPKYVGGQGKRHHLAHATNDPCQQEAQGCPAIINTY